MSRTWTSVAAGAALALTGVLGSMPASAAGAAFAGTTVITASAPGAVDLILAQSQTIKATDYSQTFDVQSTGAYVGIGLESDQVDLVEGYARNGMATGEGVGITYDSAAMTFTIPAGQYRVHLDPAPGATATLTVRLSQLAGVVHLQANQPSRAVSVAMPAAVAVAMQPGGNQTYAVGTHTFGSNAHALISMGLGWADQTDAGGSGDCSGAPPASPGYYQPTCSNGGLLPYVSPGSSAAGTFIGDPSPAQSWSYGIYVDTAVAPVTSPSALLVAGEFGRGPAVTPSPVPGLDSALRWASTGPGHQGAVQGGAPAAPSTLAHVAPARGSRDIASRVALEIGRDPERTRPVRGMPQPL
jgi:hypothetical protein